MSNGKSGIYLSIPGVTGESLDLALKNAIQANGLSYSSYHPTSWKDTQGFLVV